jgi:hypothetical protein
MLLAATVCFNDGQSRLCYFLKVFIIFFILRCIAQGRPELGLSVLVDVVWFVSHNVTFALGLVEGVAVSPRPEMLLVKCHEDHIQISKISIIASHRPLM